MAMSWLTKQTRLLLSLVGVVAMVGVVYLISPRLFVLLLNMAGMLMMGFSALAMVITFRKAKAVSPLSLIISIGISALSATILASLSKPHPGWLLSFAGLFFGALLGCGWGLTTEVFSEGGKVQSRGSGWYLAVWVLTMMITQLIPMLTGRTPATAAILLFAGAGLVLGNSGLMIARWWSTKSRFNPSQQGGAR